MPRRGPCVGTAAEPALSEVEGAVHVGFPKPTTLSFRMRFSAEESAFVLRRKQIPRRCAPRNDKSERDWVPHPNVAPFAMLGWGSYRPLFTDHWCPAGKFGCTQAFPLAPTFRVGTAEEPGAGGDAVSERGAGREAERRVARFPVLGIVSICSTNARFSKILVKTYFLNNSP
jgi:hypothetical protein